MLIAIVLTMLLFIASVSIVICIVVPKMRMLSAINVNTLPVERNERTKDRIIYERMRRKIYDSLSFLNFALRPIGDFFLQFFKSISEAYQRLADSRQYNKKQWFNAQAQIGDASNNERVEERIVEQIESAQKCADNDDFERAEQHYIEALSLNSTRLEPYRGLAKLYASQKEWQKAIEVLVFLMKLYRERIKTASETNGAQLELDCADDALQLAEMYSALQRYDDAAKSLRKAVRLQPFNPKYLDQSIEVAIISKQKLKAEKFLSQLRKTNPDNQKIGEFERRLNELHYE